ncbi:ligase-associated DNA damage response endonuclease PdeM [Roseimaritima sediminicola]|uniref:ligase-associated DNA damage response endonuclease PdeM n=1 Tax=Roseimaritima sediminicola TaxID=2662066 RepID=UPI0012984105|nr:ligase-associated DNA damage response endonuclease PdeM [Roseimaritima sediminicola]
MQTTETEITVGTTRLVLLPGRGVFLPKDRILCVADPHFGKEATFRRHGIPVPTGSTRGTLSRIERMLQATNADQLVILGDMFHAPSSLAADVRDELEQFFTHTVRVKCTLVRGNHDARLTSLPEAWGVEITDPGAGHRRCVWGHEPAAVDPDVDALLCGHLHPAVSYAVPGAKPERLPCFWLSGGCLVLPAIGRFTGTHVVQPTSGDQTWAIADQQLIPRRW